jgi:hypothetical protein
MTNVSLGSALLKLGFLGMPVLLLGLLTVVASASLPAPEQRRKAAWKWGAGSLLWLGGFLAIGASGVLDVWDARPPRLTLVLLLVIGATLSLVLSDFGTRVAQYLELRTLIASQAFRLPLELMMYRAFVEGLMPEQMSFHGYNFDVLTGASAAGIALLGWCVEIPRWLAWAFNVVGSTLLLVIVGIAIASLPSFALFGAARLNTWVTLAPYITLPVVMVPMALLGHGLLWKKLTERPVSR